MPADDLIYRNETVVFGGCLIDHFGHALVDGSARMWYLPDAPTNTKIVFLRYPRTSHAPFDALKFVELMGIDMNRVEIITEPTQFKSVIVPDEAMYPSDAYRPEFIRAFDEMRNNIQPHSVSRLYLSRRKYNFRTSLNEEYYENFFARRGYTVIYPETLPIEEQIAYVSGANEIVMMMGSMAHLLLFAKPDATATILNRSGQCLKTQIIVDQARGINPYFVDAYLNPLPVTHVDGPFLFGPNRFFQAYLDERGIAYEPDELVMDNADMRDLMSKFIDQWKRMYANPKKERSVGSFSAKDIDYYAQDCAEYYSQYVSELVSGHDDAVRLMTDDPQLVELREKNKKLKADNKKFKDSNAKLKKDNTKLTADLKKSRTEVKHLRNSKSWKITEPLRKITRLLGNR